jgi:hypothetical protein
LRGFHQLRKLDHPDELFEVLYNLAVGFERLLKIVVVLLEHSDSDDQEAFEKSLITHSHLDLLARIKKMQKLKLSTQHNDFLSLLARFYKQIRYGRFGLDSVFDGSRERREICEFLAKHLKVEFGEGESPFGTFNDDRYRKFLHQVSMKIANSLYEIVEHSSSVTDRHKRAGDDRLNGASFR